MQLDLRKREAELRTFETEACSKEEEARIKKWVREQLAAEGQSHEEAIEYLKSVMQQIEFAGGHAEVELPDPPEEEQVD